MHWRDKNGTGRLWGAGLLLTAVLILGGWARPAEAAIKLVMDGREVQASPPPVIMEGRTLVPVRLVAETLGATVDWRAEDRAVTVVRGERQVKMHIGNRLVGLAGADAANILTDVPPRILGDRTFIPLRLVAEALGVWVGWDGPSTTVEVDSSRPAAPAAAPALAIASVQPGQVITGAMDLQVVAAGALPGQVAEVRFLLLDPASGRGPVVARGKDLSSVYRLLPDPVYNGDRLLAAAAYDQAGGFLGGAVLPVQVAVTQQVFLGGLVPGQQVSATTALSTQANFLAAYVRYNLTNPATGTVKELAEADPYAPFNWTPGWADNGERTVQAVVYDRLGQAFPGPAVPVRVAMERKVVFKGPAAGAVIDGPVNLGVSLNFAASQVQYVLRDPSSGQEEVLATVGGASGYRWFPGPEKAGRHELSAVVTDDQGNTFRTGTVEVEVKGTPRLLLTSVGPKQVLAGSVQLRSQSNVPLAGIEYQLINPKTGAVRAIAGGAEALAAYNWTAAQADAGSWQLRAAAARSSGEKLLSESIPVQVHTGKLYGPAPITEKDKFLDLASGLAEDVQQEAGMSAALQVAQAILETGWGQSTPVDKYSGQRSNNLFGIKGQGPAGSVTSNTWEEYNGVSFRVDAAFRAYHDVSESWKDHQQFLLSGSRYEGFRGVMYNGVQGAWALKRAGYATDSQYPIKLMDIMRRYELDRLDEVGI